MNLTNISHKTLAVVYEVASKEHSEFRALVKAHCHLFGFFVGGSSNNEDYDVRGWYLLWRPGIIRRREVNGREFSH
jgi:hypothetical protein